MDFAASCRLKAVAQGADTADKVRSCDQEGDSPMRRLTGLFAVLLLLVPLTTAAASTAGSVPAFSDVPVGSAHAEGIAALAEARITGGCAEHRYCPRRPVTRDQMASFLSRALALEAAAGHEHGHDQFADVPPDSTHASAIESLAHAGITGGCAEGRYCPRQQVTRDQMAAFLTRAFELPASGTHHFTDVVAGSAHAASINALATAGITGGCSVERFCPRRGVTRDQMASFLARGLGLVGKSQPTPSPADPTPEPGGEPVPEGSLLAFVREPFRACSGPCDEETAIWTASVDGAELSAVTQPVGSFDRHPRWSPDGRSLAFVRTPRGDSAGEVYAVDVVGGRFGPPRRLSSTAGAHGGKGCQGQTMTPVWSPDGARVAFTCAADAVPSAASMVQMVGADGSGQLAVAADARYADARPTWSPGAERLAFVRTELQRGFGRPHRVAVWTAHVGASGVSNLRALVSDEHAADHPRWSPVGDRILYVAVDELTLRPRLRSIDASGGRATTLYTPPVDQAVQLYASAWSPDARQVAFPVGDGLTRSVMHVVPAAGGTATAVSPHDVLAFSPDWSPAGGHIAYDVITLSVAGVQAHRLATISRDGGGYQRLSAGEGYAYDARWRRGDS